MSISSKLFSLDLVYPPACLYTIIIIAITHTHHGPTTAEGSAESAPGEVGAAGRAGDRQEEEEEGARRGDAGAKGVPCARVPPAPVPPRALQGLLVGRGGVPQDDQRAARGAVQPGGGRHVALRGGAAEGERPARDAARGRHLRGGDRRQPRDCVHLGLPVLRADDVLRGQGAARARLQRAAAQHAAQHRRRAAGRCQPARERHEGRQGAHGHVRRHWRLREPDPGNQRVGGVSPVAPGAVRGGGHQAAQGRHPVRRARHGQDAPREGGGQPDQRDLPARRRQRAHPEVLRRGPKASPRALPRRGGELAVHRLHRRNRRDWHKAVRHGQQRHEGGAAHDAGAADAAGRFRQQQRRQGDHGHEPHRHAGPRPHPPGAYRSQDRVSLPG
ncbi:26S proteasome regulatory subunit T2 [Strigomonas culicis]|uniref:26S proteasome regulatory subunit T2 n=1 Tax=Strigomonas culicis TaxID=28005 RepID=S9W6F8_9TRYP|nr:26S proteasome regulatory subunit T2 [Strigomonas culicis]|eukprot:EPY31545.1 26S proteasome regulatory subunit T2 [Strigomonas culicis]